MKTSVDGRRSTVMKTSAAAVPQAPRVVWATALVVVCTAPVRLPTERQSEVAQEEAAGVVTAAEAVASMVQAATRVAQDSVVRVV